MMLRYRGLEDDHMESQELHLAVSMDNPELLSKLLCKERYKKYLDSRSGWGVPMTPLRLAASNGSVECLNILLANGSEVDCLDVKAQTPLFAAVSAGHYECVRALLKAGANPRGSIHNNATPLLTAARDGNANILKELLDYGAEANVRANLANRATPNPSRTGPLYLAAVYGHLECFTSLLLHGADPNYNCPELQLTQNIKRPQSVLEICLKHRCERQFVKLLIDFGADLYLPNVHAMSLADSPSLKLIEREKGHPRSLMSQCRVTIRRLLKQMGKLHLIDQLEIPNSIVGYLQHHNS
ncbi:ankyrin repeat and SOCS box protein 12-like [Rana temporaria]|uniref:ankyrin repeat and SOCS box protein 12-like n=1 Tax=Rana temporaria TaxID=8407 RepID=UPI001AACEE95|nr:ankyrin repeat and SOCS box protein 12-like [Rana temporaria]